MLGLACSSVVCSSWNHWDATEKITFHDMKDCLSLVYGKENDPRVGQRILVEAVWVMALELCSLSTVKYLWLYIALPASSLWGLVERLCKQFNVISSLEGMRNMLIVL